MKTIRIALSENHPLMREGLKNILNAQDDMHVINTFENCIDLLGQIEEIHPHVVILDIQNAINGDLEIIRSLKHNYPEIIVIVLTEHDNEEYIARALSYGATSYLLRNINTDKLIMAIRDAVEGDIFIPSVIASKLVARINKLYEESRKREALINFGFSEREKEIAELLAFGFTNKQIASKLFISEGTTKNYISAIYNKVGINQRSKAAVFLKDYIA